MKKVCIFCGSRTGKPEESFKQMSKDIGKFLVQNQIGLVYGGASVGIMGQIADTVLEGQGEVVGVIPRSMMVKELAHPQVQDLKIVESMHERKFLMYELSDAFLAVPGGIGTLDELFEIFTWKQLEYHDKPIGIYNFQGFYDSLIKHLNKLVETGFLTQEQREFIHISSDFTQLMEKFCLK